MHAELSIKPRENPLPNAKWKMLKISIPKEKPNAHNFSSYCCCSTLHFIFQFCGPKKINEENVKWQQTKWRHGRHSALPCAKKQAAKDEDRVKEEVDAA